MRRRLRELAVLVAVGGLMMAGCSSSDKKASVTDAQGKNVAESQSQDEGSKKVTFVLKSLGSNYWVQLKAGAVDKAEELGIDLEVLAPSSDNATEDQIRMLEDQVVSGVDLVLVAPSNSGAQVATFDKVVDAGIPLICVDTNAKGYDKKTSFIGSSNEEVGKKAGEYLTENVKDKSGAVILLRGQLGDETADTRSKGCTDALKAANPIGKGLGASPGAACGKIVFSAEDAENWAGKGEKVVLVRLETSPEDIEGMKAAQGILTVRGGMTSHAAVVARGMGKCCVSGCGAINMDEANKQFTLAGKTYHEGDWMSLDGSTGNIYDGAMPTVDANVGGDFGRIMAWADKFRRLKVRTNADTPADAARARSLGAQGIGLCRTEHMFFEGDRIAAIREMICSDTKEQREKALAKLLPMQQGDFEGIYEAMEGCPVTIRFLDPPLHEFVPTEEADIELLAKDMGKTVADIKAIIASLHEFNPMMGHRGCRLAVTFPEIAVMQTRAVIRAAINVQKKHPDWNMVPEIMIPLVGEVKELKFVKDVVVKTADEELAAAGMNMKYLVGTMIEIPRAALTADAIATEAEFFSFGTNDLTQMTFGFSRDDAGKFLPAYYDNKIYESDPFARLDQVGVGKLVDMACKLGRATRPDIHLGICGEHGGDPSSVEFCHRVGLDYVSCSPFRVPIARLAAAQAAIKDAK